MAFWKKKVLPRQYYFPLLVIYKYKQDCILPDCQPYMFQWLPLDDSISGGGGRSSKLERVSSDDHQMVVAGEMEV